MSIALAIHGGAGPLPKTEGNPDRAIEQATLRQIRDDAYRALERGDPALDVVTNAVVALEDSPHFNAARGAVLNIEGRVELDAAVMAGQGRRAGAVAAVDRIKNPIRAARLVLERSRHVLMVGDGAQAFAREQGLEMVDPSWFVTERRRAQWEQLRSEALPSGSGGTVGAVACDRYGHVAAATSTGGMVNKARGRVGDTPLIGAGTFAWDRTCAVSGTGDGEIFIRLCFAHRISAAVEAGRPLIDALEEAVAALEDLGGTGGAIAVDASGRLALGFNSGGMYRAWRSEHEGGVAVW